MRKFTDFLILFVVSLYFFRDILINPGFPLGADALAQISYASYQALNSLWYSSWEGMGFPGTVGHIIPLHILITFSFLIFNSPIGVTILLLITYLCSGIAMYSLTHYWFKDRNIALISALLYMLGRSYLDQIIQGHYTVMLAYSLFPLIPLTWSHMIRNRGLKEIIFASLIFSLYGLNAHPSIVYLSIFFLIPFFIWDLLTFKSSNNHVSYSKLVITLAVFSVLLLALSSISIMPAFLAKVISPSITDRPMSLLISTIYKTSAPSIFSAITLEGIEARAYFPKIAHGTLLTLLPILSFSAMIFRRDKYVITLTIVALFYVAFSAGPFGIFSSIYLWAIDNMPYLSGVRVPTRGLLFVNFCYAILAAVSINSIYKFIRSKEIGKLNYRLIRSGLLSITTVILILIATLSPQWPAMKFGLQSFQIPSDYANSFEYIRDQPGDFTVMNLPLQGGNGWIDPLNPEEEPGWSSTWDYGLWSSAIHGKTVVAFREWYPYSRYFLDSSRLLFFGLKLNNFMEYMGGLNVKYITSLPNAPEIEKAILSNQKGIKEVYKSGDATVFLNEYWTPAIFATPKYAVEVGRLGIFPYINNVTDSPDLESITFAPISKRTSDIESLISESDTLVFSGGDLSDLIFNSAQQKEIGIFIDASNHTPNTDWKASDRLISLGYNVASSNWSYAGTDLSGATLSMPLNLKSSGNHEIWIRLFKSPNMGELSLSLDEDVGVIINAGTTKYVSGFEWMKVTESNLSQGQHILKIINLSENATAIDQIAIIKSSEIQFETKEIHELLQNKTIAFLLRYDDFSTEWKRKFDNEQSEQYLESIDGQDSLKFTIDVPSSGFYKMAMRGRDLSGQVSNKIKLLFGPAEINSKFAPDLIEPKLLTEYSDKSFWEYYNPYEQVRASNVSTSNDGKSRGLELEVLELNRNAFSLMNHAFSPQEGTQIWSEKNYLTFRFKGMNSGSQLNLSITSSTGAKTSFTFYDQYEEWVQFIVHLRNYSPANIKIDWANLNEIKLSLDDKDTLGSFVFDEFTLWEADPNNFFQWKYVNESLYLDSGLNTIDFKSEFGLQLDMIALFSVDSIKDNTKLQDILAFNSNRIPVKLNYEKINPSHYEAHIEADVPFILHFSEAYHPQWTAYIDGDEIKPILANGFFNAFIIDKTGEYDLTIKFSAQSLVSIGAWITGISLLICSFYLLFLAIKSLIHNKLYLFKRKDTP